LFPDHKTAKDLCQYKTVIHADNANQANQHHKGKDGPIAEMPFYRREHVGIEKVIYALIGSPVYQKKHHFSQEAGYQNNDSIIYKVNSITLVENVIRNENIEIKTEHPDAHQHGEIKIHEFSPVQTDYRTGNRIPDVEHGKNQDKEKYEYLGHVGRDRERQFVLLFQDFTDFFLISVEIPFLGPLPPLPKLGNGNFAFFWFHDDKNRSKTVPVQPVMTLL
jgi:hypothetical protein